MIGIIYDYMDIFNIAGIVFGGALIMLSVYLINQYMKHRALRTEMDDWISTEGVLINVNVISDGMAMEGGKSAHYECAYTYKVFGKEYVGTRLRNAAVPPGVGIEHLFNLLGLTVLYNLTAPYIEGKPVTVWYDIRHPERCTLSKSGAYRDLIGAAIYMTVGLMFLSTAF